MLAKYRISFPDLIEDERWTRSDQFDSWIFDLWRTIDRMVVDNFDDLYRKNYTKNLAQLTLFLNKQNAYLGFSWEQIVGQ